MEMQNLADIDGDIEGGDLRNGPLRSLTLAEVIITIIKL